MPKRRTPAKPRARKAAAEKAPLDGEKAVDAPEGEAPVADDAADAPEPEPEPPRTRTVVITNANRHSISVTLASVGDGKSAAPATYCLPPRSISSPLLTLAGHPIRLPPRVSVRDA